MHVVMQSHACIITGFLQICYKQLFESDMSLLTILWLKIHVGTRCQGEGEKAANLIIETYNIIRSTVLFIYCVRVHANSENL